MELRTERPLVEADVPDPSAFAIALADAYRQTALAGADMRATAAAVEAVREAQHQHNEPFPTGREIDDQIGRATDTVLLDALVAVRTGYENTLHDAYRAWLSTVDYPAWVERVGCALAAWKLRLCQLLAAHPPASGIPEGDGAAVAALPTQLERMIQDDWDLALPTLTWLGGHDGVADEDRARMLARAAQVDLYFTQDIASARERVNRAAVLATDTRARAEVECVRGQCLRAEQSVPEAIGQLEQAAATDRRFIESFAYRGDIALEANDLSSAESWYRRAISAYPGSDMGYMRLVRLLARSELIGQRGTEIAAIMDRAAIVSPLNAAQNFSFASDMMREGQRLDDAMRFAERAVAADRERGRARYAKALVHTARGEWRQALDDFRFALKREATKYSRTRWHALGVEDARPLLLEELARTPSDPLVRDALLCFVEQSNDKPDQRDTALAVLDALASGGAAPDGKTRAVLANARGDVHYYNGEYPEAGAAFAEAWELDPSVAVHGTNLVAAHREMRRWDDAEQMLKRVHQVSGDDIWRDSELATIANGRANDIFDEGRYEEAAEFYARAATLRADEPVYRTNQVLAYEQMIATAGDAIFLDSAVDAMERACALRPDDATYRARLASLRDMRRGAQRYGIRVLQRAPSVEPIRIHIASNLTPFVSSDREEALDKELKASIAGLRGWITEDYGIDLAPIRFVEADELEPGTYALELFGVAARIEILRTDRRLLAGASLVQATRAAGIEGEDAVSPLNGDAAMWIGERDWERVRALGLALWSIMQYALYDLAYQVLRRLKEFVGHCEVSALLTARQVASAKAFLGNHARLTFLVRVLHGLLGERVPITALGAIAALVSTSTGEKANVLVRRARMLPEVQATLPGRTGSSQRTVLGDHWDEEIFHAIRYDGDEPYLVMEPERVQALLRDVRELVARMPGLSAIVVRDAEIRAHLRRIVELEFPQLWVLARAELQDVADAALSIAAAAMPIEAVAR